ncbi:uncharacterized protein LOC131696286 [Topomyia yanbarensis]|uniref:uncharacterized protein LOC131696286 n=1 Tax=Topomyia yanbarensis TaxID=2498891 RepID=UPI00273BCDA0|nr:uncharacterized protein LOC131696286 [Topomyia yanbarensis]
MQYEYLDEDFEMEIEKQRKPKKQKTRKYTVEQIDNKYSLSFKQIQTNYADLEAEDESNSATVGLAVESIDLQTQDGSNRESCATVGLNDEVITPPTGDESNSATVGLTIEPFKFNTEIGTNSATCAAVGQNIESIATSSTLPHLGEGDNAALKALVENVSLLVKLQKQTFNCLYTHREAMDKRLNRMENTLNELVPKKDGSVNGRVQ